MKFDPFIHYFILLSYMLFISVLFYIIASRLVAFFSQLELSQVPCLRYRCFDLRIKNLKKIEKWSKTREN